MSITYKYGHFVQITVDMPDKFVRKGINIVFWGLGRSTSFCNPAPNQVLTQLIVAYLRQVVSQCYLDKKNFRRRHITRGDTSIDTSDIICAYPLGDRVPCYRVPCDRVPCDRVPSETECPLTKS